MSRSRVFPAAIALGLLLVSTAVSAQSPAAAITPPDAYRAALVAYSDAVAAADDEDGADTVAEMQERLGPARERLNTELDRLAAITPDPCYAEAHGQYIGYQTYTLELLDDWSKALETATTVWDMLPLAMAASAEGEARFPAFYKPAPSPAPGTVTMGGSGNVFDYVLGFDVLNTCGPPAPSASPGV